MRRLLGSLRWLVVPAFALVMFLSASLGPGASTASAQGYPWYGGYYGGYYGETNYGMTGYSYYGYLGYYTYNTSYYRYSPWGRYSSYRY